MGSQAAESTEVQVVPKMDCVPGATQQHQANSRTVGSLVATRSSAADTVTCLGVLSLLQGCCSRSCHTIPFPCRVCSPTAALPACLLCNLLLLRRSHHAGVDGSQRLSSLFAGQNRSAVEGCTRKCVPTCVRGGSYGGAPGLGPISLRKEVVVFKDGFRSRQYCLSK
jgi:hypothetical protein